MACTTKRAKQQKGSMQAFGIASLIFVGILIVLWAVNPVFFSAYVIPWAIFISIILVSIIALVSASSYCNGNGKVKK